MLQTTPGRTAHTPQGEWLFFSGYAYLGIHQLPQVQKAYEAATRQFGWLYPSARISNTPLALYTQAEQALSTLTGTADTVLLGSGFMAGRAAVEVLTTNAIVYRSPFCHPAIATGQPTTGSWQQWVQQTEEAISNYTGQQPQVILSDAVNPLTAEVADFSFLSHIQRPVICLIDDSHGMGVLGNKGEGIFTCLPRKDTIEYVFTYSLAKAMNIPAGAISCSQPSTAQLIRQTAWYGTTTPPAPAPLQVWLNNADVYEQQLLKLRQNIDVMRQGIGSWSTIASHPLLPVFRLPTGADAAYFEKHQILISSFAYPNPDGIPVNRVVLSALHTPGDIQALIAALQSCPAILQQ